MAIFYTDSGSFFDVNVTRNLLVSGATTLSGSLGQPNPTLNIYGDINQTGYTRYLPVVNNLDASLSASYIYVSGSTNDLYFTQNGAGYANTTRLRWLEGNLYTGLLNGGVITATTGSTTFNISSGSGIVVNINASLSTNPYPTIQYVNWGTYTSQPITYLTSSIQTFLGIDGNGQIIQQTVPWSNGQYNTSISLGTVLHQNKSIVNASINYPNVAYGWKQRSYGFIKAFGSLKISGYTLSASGTLGLTVGSGTAFSDGRNYQNDPSNPSYITDAGTTVSKIFRYYQSGSDFVQDTNSALGYTGIDTTQYNPNGTGVLTSASPSKFYVHRIFWYPNSATKGIVDYYGLGEYSTLDEAQSSYVNESFLETPNTQQNAIFLGVIIIKGNKNFSNASDYRIIQGGLFRGAGTGGGGGGGGATTPGGTTTQIQYNDGGTFNGVSVLTYDGTTLRATGSFNGTLTGSLHGTASWATSALTSSNITGGSINYIPLWNSNITLSSSSLYQVAPKQIIVGATASVHIGNEEAFAVYQGATTSYNLISGHSNINSYSQLNIVNFNTGSQVSSDVVATADNGNESTGFIDMGINGSGYTNTGLVGDANDAYLYSTGENLLIGNASTGKQVVIFNGGTDAASNAKMFIHDTNIGVIGINTDTIGDINNPAALRILPPNNNTFNMIETEADLNGFVQSVFSNINAGPSASSDIVAHNDSGSTFSYFIDMGINSSTYNQGYVGGPNDTYLIGAGKHMHIGNIGYEPGIDSSLYFFTGGTTDEFTRIYVSASGEVGVNTQNPKYQFDVSGSGRFTNGLTITGSLITSGSYKLDTSNGTLVTDNTTSVNWASRELTTVNGSTAFEYATTVDDYVSTNLYLTQLNTGQVQRNLSENILYSGHIIQGTIDAGVTSYDIMYLDTDGTWKALKNLPTVSTKMVGIEVGGNILLEGDMTVSDDGSVGTYVTSADHGLPVYLSTTTGQLTTAAPGTGVIRVVGHIYYQNPVSTNVWLMKFRPSNEWYEI